MQPSPLLFLGMATIKMQRQAFSFSFENSGKERAFKKSQQRKPPRAGVRCWGSFPDWILLISGVGGCLLFVLQSLRCTWLPSMGK